MGVIAVGIAGEDLIDLLREDGFLGMDDLLGGTGVGEPPGEIVKEFGLLLVTSMRSEQKVAKFCCQVFIVAHRKAKSLLRRAGYRLGIVVPRCDSLFYLIQAQGTVDLAL